MFHKTELQSYRIHKEKFKHIKVWRWRGVKENANRSTLYGELGAEVQSVLMTGNRVTGKTSRGEFLQPKALALVFPC